MVVTRSMKSKLEQKRKHNIRQCFNKLERLSLHDIDKVMVSTKSNKLKGKRTKGTIQKKQSQSLATSHSRNSNTIWSDLKKNRLQLPLVNSIVLAKMRTYSPWPAKLISFTDKKAKVYFFGTNNHGDVPLGDVVSFADSSELVLQLASMKIKYFKRAVREAEVFRGVPIEYSMLNGII